MDLLKKVEEKWKEVTLEEAVLLLVCVVFAVIIVAWCAAMLLRKGKPKEQGGAAGEVVVDVVSGRSGPGREELKRSLRWSERNKVCAATVRDGGGVRSGSESGSASARRGGASPMLAMWQRRILMGERCKLPGFSGVILYDERGHPLHDEHGRHHHQQQHDVASNNVKPAAAVTTTLKELF